jgi:peptide/nickel transport system permease protein
MPKFLARRAAMLVAALLVSSFAIFASLDLAPGDPLATLSGGRTLPPEAVAQLRAQYHLDDPFLSRYVHWLGNALHGDLGTSIAFREPVSNVISARIGVTIELVAYAALLIVLFGVGLGLLSGLRRGAIDSSILVVTTVFAAVPSFVAAIVLLSLFSVNLGWFPALGAGDGGVADAIKHLTLPAIALALSAMAIVVRVTRVAVRTELGREHVQTAVSRGIPFRQVVRRHVLRNAAIPVTTVVGITITALIALSSVVERAFSLDGLGAALVQAALSKDFAVVQGISLLFVAAFVVANALVDLCYALLDPRVAIGARAT